MIANNSSKCAMTARCQHIIDNRVTIASFVRNVETLLNLAVSTKGYFRHGMVRNSARMLTRYIGKLRSTITA
jgi:uncharacterized radical SAM superfamily Fe-S cluster-containing enzyme